MNITTRDRSDLKQYFVRNAIPTQSNFAELIDAGFNQRDDGIAKPPGDPLSIEAVGDATSQRKVLNLYESFTDQSATWVLSLNPRGDPAVQATARAGFSISDGAGNSRLFIDKASGNVGIGTTTPGQKLTVAGIVEASAVGIRVTNPTIDLAIGDSDTGLQQQGEGELAIMTNNVERVRINNSGNVGIGIVNPGSNRLWVSGNLVCDRIGIGTSPSIHLAVGDSDTGLKQQGAGKLAIMTNNVERVRIGNDGKVGIGTTAPLQTLDVNGRMHVSDGVIQKGGTAITGTSDLGLYSRTAFEWIRIVSTAAPIHFFTDGGTGTNAVLVVESGGPVRITKAIHAGNSDIYFTRTDHKHTGDGNTIGHAAIENATDHDALMILGRYTASGTRKIKLLDNVEVTGTIVYSSSREIKTDISALSASDYQKVIDQLRQTPVFRYRFKQEGIERKLHLGVVAEECPGEILDETGKSVSLLDFTGFLLAAVKAQQAQIEDLQAAVDRLG